MYKYLVSEQKVVGLNCYHCAFGRDGCGTSFNSKGSGVIQQTSSSYTYCVVKDYLKYIYLQIIGIVHFRNKSIRATPMPLVVMDQQRLLVQQELSQWQPLLRVALVMDTLFTAVTQISATNLQ